MDTNRPDMIGPRRLQPAAQDRSLTSFREQPSRFVAQEGRVPFVRSGAQAGVIPGARPPAPPQPSLVVAKGTLLSKAEPEAERPAVKPASHPDLTRQPGHVPMTREHLGHQLKRGTYSIISAGRNKDGGEGHLPADHEMFHKRHEQLRHDLDKHGFSYTEVQGKWGGDHEPSFVVHHQAHTNPSPEGAPPAVMVHHKSPSEFSKVRELGKKYNQNTVIHAHQGHNEMHYTTGEHEGKHMAGIGHTMKPEANDDYTQVNHPRGDSSKFELHFDWDHKLPMHQAMLKAVMDKLRQSALRQGQKVEMEHKHTIRKIEKEDPPVPVAARCIASDHLDEDPHYYRKLRVMEGKDDAHKSVVGMVRVVKAQNIRMPPASAAESLQPEPTRGASYPTQVVVRDGVRKSLWLKV